MIGSDQCIHLLIFLCFCILKEMEKERPLRLRVHVALCRLSWFSVTHAGTCCLLVTCCRQHELCLSSPSILDLCILCYAQLSSFSCPFLFFLLLSLLDISSFLISVPTHQGEVGQSHCVSRSCSCNVFLMWFLVTRVAPQSGSESVRAHFLGGLENLAPLGDWLHIRVSSCRPQGRELF